MLDQEFKYFLAHQSEWSESHFGQYVVITGQTVFGFFADEDTAYQTARKALAPGTFLIQHCIPGPESYTQTFFSNVYF